jgi:hypothetical protein
MTAQSGDGADSILCFFALTARVCERVNDFLFQTNGAGAGGSGDTGDRGRTGPRDDDGKTTERRGKCTCLLADALWLFHLRFLPSPDEEG